MKKKIVSLLLTLTVMLTMVPTAFAVKTQPLYGRKYSWGSNGSGERWLNGSSGVKTLSVELDSAGGNMKFQTRDWKDIDVEEIWFEENGEPSEVVCFQEMAWDGFSTWLIQASELCSGEICVRSGRVVYRMPLEVTTPYYDFYDEDGRMWSSVEITEDPTDMPSKFTNKTYGVPGEKKTIEVHLAEIVRTGGNSPIDGMQIEWNDEKPVMVAERINGVMVSNGVNVHGMEAFWDGGSVVYITATMPEEETNCHLLFPDYELGRTLGRKFDLIPIEPPAAEPVIPTDPGLSNFKSVNTYTAGQFADVAASYWGAPNIAKAYELGLMKGSSDSAFDPEGSVTVAQTVTMAARLHSIYTTGSENFVQSGVWYQTYVDYCKANGILKKDFADYNAPAKRADFAAILAAAMPAEALSAINTVTSIPDVAEASENGAAIYALYRAGILTGNDAQGTFGPETSINRAAAAAILTRMADVSLRKSIQL